jgi:hypothetical protein
MNSALQRIRAWRSLRERRALERWEQLRAKGKTRFVIQSALTYGFVIVGATDAIEHLFDGPQPISLFKVIFFALFGVGMGLSMWSDMESKYKDALRKARAKPLPDIQTLPQSGQGVSKA